MPKLPPVYTVVYVAEGQSRGSFFLAHKPLFGYWFYHGDSGINLEPQGQSFVYPKNKGGNKPALPGGGMEAADGNNPITGGMREFFEETACDLTKFGAPTRASAQWFQAGAPPRASYYAAAYIPVTNDALAAILQQVRASLTNVVPGVIAKVTAKPEPTITGEQILKMAACPRDNELDTCQIWSVQGNWAMIQNWRNDPVIGWFYCILQNLRVMLLIDPQRDGGCTAIPGPPG